MITAEYLRKILSYNPETGVFRWRIAPADHVPAGTLAGNLSQGYRKIMIDGGYDKASRLAFLYMTGEWPVAEIDHINLDMADDRWLNLRGCTRSQNEANKPRNTSNTSGAKGVYWYKARDKWRAQITINGKYKHLGYFDTRDDAAAAYAAAAKEHFGEFARWD